MTKVLLAAVAICALPTLAMAGCFGSSHQEANLSCATGTVWDPVTEACVPSTS